MTTFILYCISLVIFVIIWTGMNDDFIHEIKGEQMSGGAFLLDYVKFIIVNVSFVIIFIIWIIKLLQYAQLI